MMWAREKFESVRVVEAGLYGLAVGTERAASRSMWARGKLETVQELEKAAVKG